MNETIIKCIKCHTDNPANAKFCRKCGQPILTDQGEYTPDLFPDIDLSPISIQPIRFVNGWQKMSFVLLPILVIFLVEICGDFKCDFKDEFGSDAFDVVSIGGFILSFILAISVLVGLKKICRLIAYKSNADFIESNIFEGELKRIAKNKKLGLFDQKKRKILLKSKYDAISKFDEQHILVVEATQKGLYSISRKKLIIPIVFDDIKSDKIGTIAAVKDMQVFHYDIYGKELR